MEDLVESAVPPRPNAVRFLREMVVAALWWFAAWVSCYVYVAATADPAPPCGGSECFSTRDWETAGVLLLGAPLALAGAVLSAAAVAVVIAAKRLRWPAGVVGTAVTWAGWLVLAAAVALLVAYRTLR